MTTTNLDPTHARSPTILGSCLLAVLLSLHFGYSWLAMGGWDGMTGPWPLAGDDHPIAEHNAWVTRHFLLQNGTAAGYDPYFMAGYPKSLLSSPSSTLFEILGLITGGRSPIQVHKVATLLGLASLPWLLWAAGSIWGVGQRSVVASIGLLNLYIWTDGGGAGFPTNFARYGMVAYMVAIPLGMVVIAAFAKFLRMGGFKAWAVAAMLASICFMMHITSVLILVPAALALCFATGANRKVLRVKTYAQVAAMAFVVFLANAFWWFPLFFLRSMSREGNPFFTNPDVWNRMMALIGWRWPNEMPEPAIQAVILGLSLYGLAILSRRDAQATVGLATFAGAGFFWGYLAGYWSGFDFLQPGRQTYAFYVAGSLLGGVGVADLFAKIADVKSKRLMIGAVLALSLIGSRIFLPDLIKWAGMRWKYPFLGTRVAPPHLDSIVRWIRLNMKPGERLYYEECGEAIIGQPDPYGGGRLSGLLPEMTGVEMVGGFYLYVGLKTNFTQIGERDKKPALFNGPWTRERFIRYARLYRPAAIICWSEEAKQFCRLNSDLVEISFTDGRVLGGRVKGFEGATVRGRATVVAVPGQLRVSNLTPDLDGLVVLRYHFAPGLRSQPAIPMEPVRLEDDPVPFIGLRPSAGKTSTLLDMAFPPGR